MDTKPAVILLVDDNPAGAQTMSMLLGLQGFSVVTASTGKEALSLFKENSPSVVLLDIGLPDINGLDVARAIRDAQGERRPLLVAVTGWGADSDKQKTREAGFDVHLTKPVNYDEIERVVINHIG
jgi:CheY-like chemotaxis protein